VARGAERRSTPGPEAGPPGPPEAPEPLARRRQAVVAGVAVLGAVALGGAAWLVAGTPGDHPRRGHEHAPDRAAGGATVRRQVGAEQVARLAGPTHGRVTLSVRAEVPARGAARRLRAVPAGAPVTLSFDLPSAGPAGRPRLAAHRLQTSISATAAGHDHGGGGSARGPAVPLTRAETFLFNRRTGVVAIPGPSAAGRPGHSHQPGVGLSQTIPGGGWAFAATLPRAAGRTSVDPTGRWLAVAYPATGRVELLDLLRHERTGAVSVGGRPGALRFQPDGARLWVADEARGRVAVLDVAARRMVRALPAGRGPVALAFDATGRRALVTAQGAGRATLVDVARLRPLGTAPVRRPVDAAYVPTTRAFAVATRDGRIATLPAAGRELRSARALSLGGSGDVRGIGVAPDGRTGVALDAGADELAVVDLRAERLLRRVQAGDEPSDLVFLGRFAVVRNARSADLTWVDTAEPERSNNLPVGDRPAAGLSLSADGRAALATLPAQRQVAKLHVMMGRPMVMDGIANTAKGDVAASVATALERTGSRRVEQRTVFDHPGRYHLDLRLADGSRAAFTLPVSGHSAEAGRVVAERRRLRAAPGQTVRVRFRVVGASPQDAQVLALSTSAGAVRQLRTPAHAVGGGRYEATLTPQVPGAYRLSLLSERQDLATGPRSGAALVVRARAR
jgi:hypothetical protein